MKQLFFTLLLFVSWGSDIKAQLFNTYPALPNIHTQFYFEELFTTPSDSSFSSFIFMSNLKGQDFPYSLPDTLIVYKGNSSSHIDTIGYVIIHFDRVFHLKHGDTGDYKLLYDFTLEIGDTAYYDNVLQDYVSVIGIEQIEAVHGLSAPTFLDALSLSNGDEWVQGIGSLRHPFRPIVDRNLTNFNICFLDITVRDSNDLVYTDFIRPSGCSNVVSTSNSQITNKLKIYPNPIINNNFTIDTDESLQINALVLYDLHGRTTILEAESIGNKFNIQLPQLANGVYLLRIDTDNGIINKKIQILN